MTTRRQFLKVVGGAGAALAISPLLPPMPPLPPPEADHTIPEIGEFGIVLVQVHYPVPFRVRSVETNPISRWLHEDADLPGRWRPTVESEWGEHTGRPVGATPDPMTVVVPTHVGATIWIEFDAVAHSFIVTDDFQSIVFQKGVL